MIYRYGPVSEEKTPANGVPFIPVPGNPQTMLAAKETLRRMAYDVTEVIWKDDSTIDLEIKPTETVTITELRANLYTSIDTVIDTEVPLKIRRRGRIVAITVIPETQV